MLSCFKSCKSLCVLSMRFINVKSLKLSKNNEKKSKMPFWRKLSRGWWKFDGDTPLQNHKLVCFIFYTYFYFYCPLTKFLRLIQGSHSLEKSLNLGEVLEKSLNSIFSWKVLKFLCTYLLEKSLNFLQLRM